jgi:hypothetical protein
MTVSSRITTRRIKSGGVIGSVAEVKVSGWLVMMGVNNRYGYLLRETKLNKKVLKFERETRGI